jgi:hypothetical protein
MTKRRKKRLSVAANQVVVTSDVLVSLYHVFKESITQQNNDMQYMFEKLALYNSMGEAMADHIKELADAMADADRDKDNEECTKSWRLFLRKQQRNLTTLADLAETCQKTTAQLFEKLN